MRASDIGDEGMELDDGGAIVHATAGTTHTTVVTVRSAGVPEAGATVNWSRTGVNAGSGTVLTGDDGTAAVGWSSSLDGQDELTLWLDTVPDGEPTPGETIRRRTVVWSGATPPRQRQPARTMALNPRTDSRRIGETHRVVATTTNIAAGTTIRYEITGSNPGSGTAVVGADGLAEMRWDGRATGTDLLRSYADVDGDGARDTDEPSAGARITWLSANRFGEGRRLEDLGAPTPFQTVHIQPDGGRIRARLGASGARWVTLRGAISLPVGSYVDASRGAVLVQSATNASGSRRQTARVAGGAFRIRQPRASRPIAELTLSGASFRSRCRRGGRRVVRSLRGTGRALVRIVGRHSTTTTLRGAGWTVADRCDGTRTSLGRSPRGGRADVRDRARRRTVRIRAGRSYLARPRTGRR